MSSVLFTNEQKEFMNSKFESMKNTMLKNIMDDEDEFEGTEDSFRALFERVLNVDDLEIGESVKKTKSRAKSKIKVDGGEKRKASSYLNWLWNEDINIGMSKIKTDFPDLDFKEHRKKAGEIWKSMSQEQKDEFKSK